MKFWLFCLFVFQSAVDQIFQLQRLIYISLHLQLAKGKCKYGIGFSFRKLEQCLGGTDKHSVPVKIFIRFYIKLSIFYFRVKNSLGLAGNVELIGKMFLNAFLLLWQTYLRRS